MTRESGQFQHGLFALKATKTIKPTRQVLVHPYHYSYSYCHHSTIAIVVTFLLFFTVLHSTTTRLDMENHTGNTPMTMIPKRKLRLMSPARVPVFYSSVYYTMEHRPTLVDPDPEISRDIEEFARLSDTGADMGDDSEDEDYAPGGSDSVTTQRPGGKRPRSPIPRSPGSRTESTLGTRTRSEQADNLARSSSSSPRAVQKRRKATTASRSKSPVAKLASGKSPRATSGKSSRATSSSSTTPKPKKSKQQRQRGLFEVIAPTPSPKKNKK